MSPDAGGGRGARRGVRPARCGDAVADHRGAPAVADRQAHRVLVVVVAPADVAGAGDRPRGRCRCAWARPAGGCRSSRRSCRCRSRCRRRTRTRPANPRTYATRTSRSPSGGGSSWPGRRVHNEPGYRSPAWPTSDMTRSRPSRTSRSVSPAPRARCRYASGSGRQRGQPPERGREHLDRQASLPGRVQTEPVQPGGGVQSGRLRSSAPTTVDSRARNAATAGRGVLAGARRHLSSTSIAPARSPVMARRAGQAERGARIAAVDQPNPGVPRGGGGVIAGALGRGGDRELWRRARRAGRRRPRRRRRTRP